MGQGHDRVADLGVALVGAVVTGLMREVVAVARWAWRTLTMMRTALILLLLLALASVPGSLLPQRGTAPLRVSQFLRDHPAAGPWLDRFHLFDVFASAWFAAVYLLLFISLVGCIVPRTLGHVTEMRAVPGEAPRNLERLAGHTSWHQDDVDLLSVATRWRRAGWRVAVRDGELSAERGYLRETGNLFFHVSLLALLVAVGLGSASGFKGTVIVREGSGFADNVTQYDTFAPGRLFHADHLVPFSFTLDDFAASYQVGGMQSGAPRDFTAKVTVREKPGATARTVDIKVNQPLRVAGTSVYLVGHGYAPEFTLRDRRGEVVWQDAAVFLPLDGNFTSQGVIKSPDTTPQVGIEGYFAPTAPAGTGHDSVFPAATDPKVYLTLWTGDLGLDSGVPQSVYRLDTTHMTVAGSAQLTPGQSWDLPAAAGTLEFTGFREWASFSITRDQGKGWALGAGAAAITGLSLSLLVPRRRVWLRVTQSHGRTLCEVAGLSKTEAPGLLDDIQRLVALARGEEGPR